MTPEPAVILFDGVCNLCNAAVRFVLKRDREDRFRFAPLQGRAARELLARVGGHGGASASSAPPGRLHSTDPESVILVEDSQVFEKSTAALRIARRLGGPYGLLYVLVVVPRVLRDPVYDLVAGRRYRWFGRRDRCMVPTVDTRRKFLD